MILLVIALRTGGSNNMGSYSGILLLSDDLNIKQLVTVYKEHFANNELSKKASL